MKPFAEFALLASVTAVALAGCSTQKPAPAASETPAAAITVPKPPAGDTDAKQSAFLAAAEPFENLTESAQAASSVELNTLIVAARKAADGIKPALPAPRKASLETNLSDIQTASAKNDRTGIALASVEGYRTLVESAADNGKVPTAVSLLDYSGFRYQADLTAKPSRWDDMAIAVAFAQQEWSGIADRITDKTLKADFANSVADMGRAAKARDAKAAKVASTHELDLVDELEGFFSK